MMGLPVMGDIYLRANSTREALMSNAMILRAEYACATAAVINPIGPQPLKLGQLSSVTGGASCGHDGDSLMCTEIDPLANLYSNLAVYNRSGPGET